MYKRLQIGYVIIFAMLLGLATVVAVGRPFTTILWIVSAVLVAVLLVFSTLTVVVDTNRIRFFFNFGLFGREIPLAAVVSCAPVENPAWWGWGIRRTPRGMLYNVSGTRAVELTLASGEQLRIGTAEPERLCEAINGALTPR